jgi:transcriptional regulator GlxA family with amidase domain
VSATVALLVFDGCDLLDVGGPYEVLLTANRLAGRRGEPQPFELHVVSPDGRPVTAYGGLGLAPTQPALDGAIDVLVVPGLVDVETALADTALLTVVRTLADQAQLVTSVCTGAFLLAATGLLAGRAATTHHEDMAALAELDVGRVVEGARWVDSGDVITAAGLSSGLSLGLHLADRLAGRELAVATAAQIEYAWSPDDGVRS